jgi:hypothetical protein
VFCFNFQLFLAGFTNPVMLALDKSVVMDAFAVVVRAEITLHAVILQRRLAFGVRV